MIYINSPVKGRRAATHVKVGLSLPSDLTRALDNYAKLIGEPRSRVVEAALRKYLGVRAITGGGDD